MDESGENLRVYCLRHGLEVTDGQCPVQGCAAHNTFRGPVNYTSAAEIFLECGHEASASERIQVALHLKGTMNDTA